MRGRCDYARMVREMQHCHLWGWRKGLWSSEGTGWWEEIKQRNGLPPPPEPSNGNVVYGHLEFSPVRTTSDFWPTEL